MLKRVFPERQHKSTNRSGSSSKSPIESPSVDAGSVQSSPRRGYPKSRDNVSDHSSATSVTTVATSSSSTNSSPLKSSTVLTTTRLSTSSSNSPIKSEAVNGGGVDQCLSGATNLSKLKHISRSCSSTEFQSLKLESMSTVEDFKSVSKTISSALEIRDGLHAKQSSTAPATSVNDAQESTSMSTPSDDDTDNDPAESLFRHQAKFFCQMKDYLLSQQSSLRQHLEVLNATVASRKKMTASRRQRFQPAAHSVHIPAKQNPEVTPEIRGNNHDIDLLNEFHSCSSTEKSDDDMQVCPLCGVEVEDSENAAALEEHVASHWCSLDDPI